MQLRTLFLLAFFLPFGPATFGQGSWTQLNDFPGSPNFTGTKFVIGKNAYYLEGYDGSTCYDRLWKFDTQSKTWSQMASFPGNMTKGDPVGFSIDSMGYIGTGVECGGSSGSEFWAYDPSSDTWQQKASLPGTGIHIAVGFSIDGRGYIGLGRHSYSDPNYTIYRYDPPSDSWTTVTTFPGTNTTGSEALTHNGKVYIVGGGDASGGLGTDALWSYDPVLDDWNQLTDLPGNGRKAHMGFAIAEHLYFGTGWNGSTYYSDMYRYNTQTNTWTQVSDFGGGKRRHTEEFAVGGMGYVIGGMDEQSTYKKDVWQYRSEFVSQKEFKEKGGASFQVQPNPAKELITVELTQHKKRGRELRVYSSKGRLIRSTTVKNGPKRMDIGGLASGVYFLEIRKEGNTPERKKLIVE